MSQLLMLSSGAMHCGLPPEDLEGLYESLDAEGRDCLLMARLVAAAVDMEQVREVLEARLFIQSVEGDVESL